MTGPTALLLVDLQNDFCEGGALGVDGGAALVERVSDYARAHRASAHLDYVVATRDYHIDPGSHFSDDPDFHTSWPPHCKAGTAGCSFHPGLDVGVVDEVFSKGQYSDGYSGFEGEESGGVPLARWLFDRGVTQVEIAGIATDFCVRATTLHAVRVGLAPVVLREHCAGVSREGAQAALAELERAGAVLR